MKRSVKNKNLLFRLVGFIGIIAALIFLQVSCNIKKTNETKTIVNQLNDSKFQKTKDQKSAAFLVASAERYLREIKLAQLAQQRATQVDVKELGRMNEEFNTLQLLSLLKLAKSKSISIPTSPGILDEEIYKSIHCKSETVFDKAYCDEVISSQNKSINFFEKTILETGDQDIKNWAADAIPSMEQQLSYALMCQKNCIRWQRHNALML